MPINKTDRDIAWEPPDPGTWTLEAAHGSELPSPMFGALMQSTFEEGTRRGLEPLGLPLSHAEMRLVNGWPYFSFFLHDVPRTSGRTPPQWVIKVFTRIHPGFRRRTKIARSALENRVAERCAAEWLAERDDWIDRNVALGKVDVGSLDDHQLADHLRAMMEHARRSVVRHFELIFASIPLGRWFVTTEEWGLDPAAIRRAVMHGTPVHEEARRRIDAVITALGEARPESFDEVRAHSSEAAAALDDYLTHHGCWATSDSPQSRTVADHPGAVLAAFAARRDRSTHGSERSPDEMLAQLRELVPSDRREEFDRAAADAHETYKMLDDNSGILASWVSGLLGMAVRAAADRLHRSGLIADPDHVWALDFDELVALVEGASPLSADQVEERHQSWRDQADLDPPRSLGAAEEPPPDPGVFPAPVAELMRSVLAFLDDKFNETHQVCGLGEVPVTGRAVVAEDPGDALDRLEPGDILVTIATTPAYNAVLGIAGGVIVSEGGLSCHTAVVARELGLPALLGYARALEEIPDGSIVTLDPVAATVTVNQAVGV